MSVILSGLLAAANAAADERAAEDDAAAEMLYLEVFTNGLDQNLIVEVERRAGAFRVYAADLQELGLRLDGLAPGADRRIALDDIRGLTYRYRPLEQRLELEVADARLTPQLLGNVAASTAQPRSDHGAVFNYSLHVQSKSTDPAQTAARVHAPLLSAGYGRRLPVARTADARQAGEQKNKTAVLDLDMREFSSVGLFANSGYATAEAGETDAVRYDTYWTYSSLAPLRTYTVGDFIGSSLSWTRSLRLGGARVAKNFALRPDLVTFPQPTLGGSALVPTTVDLYVNGIRQFSSETRAGPFLLTDPLALTGAGLVSIVYRDELGREIRTTQPLYVDSRLLDTGLSDYALEVGYPRRNYGVASDDYGDDAATMASLRYGLTDRFTIEGHGESSEGLQNVGIGGLFGLGRFGVLSASISVSDADGRGKQTSAGYQYFARRWSLDIYESRTHGDYQDLGSLEDAPVPNRQSHAGLTFSLGRKHTLSIYDVHQEASQLGGSHVTSLGYSSTWNDSRLGTYVTLFHDADQQEADGAYLGISFALGGRATVNSGASAYGDQRTTIFGAGRPVDYDVGGFGWNFYSERGNDDYGLASARLDYRFRYGDWSALVESGSQGQGDADDYSNTSVHGSGAVVFMRRQWLAARSIYDGFALVSTRGTPHVPVLRENRLLGETNRNGFYLVPDLPSYQTSRISIDTLNLPVDVSVAAVRLEANPREGSGLLVEFSLDRYRGATLVLVDRQQQPLPPGTRVTLLDTGATALIGYDGQVFFPALEPVNRVSADTLPGPCEVDVRFEPEQAMGTLGPFVCAGGETP